MKAVLGKTPVYDEKKYIHNMQHATITKIPNCEKGVKSNHYHFTTIILLCFSIKGSVCDHVLPLIVQTHMED